jgi:hypothetical protein
MTLPGLDADGATAEIGYVLNTWKMDGVAAIKGSEYARITVCLR